MQSGQMPAGTPNQAWASLDLLLLFSQLYDNGHAPAVHEILELPQAQCPDLLVLSTASALRCAQCLLSTIIGLHANNQLAALPYSWVTAMHACQARDCPSFAFQGHDLRATTEQ